MKRRKKLYICCNEALRETYEKKAEEIYGSKFVITQEKDGADVAIVLGDIKKSEIQNEMSELHQYGIPCHVMNSNFVSPSLVEQILDNTLDTEAYERSLGHDLEL